MTTLRMQTDEVRVAARQLSQSTEQIHFQLEDILSKVRAINWNSPTREAYLTDLARLIKAVQSVAQDGDLLFQRVQREVDEWESVAASFGMNMGQGWGVALANGIGINTVRELGDKEPQSMGDIARLIMDGKDPIRIYKIGPNEYLVIIQGTNPTDSNVSNNWGSAITTGLNLSSDFQEHVALAVMGLPAGAVIHMAGHSQGGIVANNLAADERLSGNGHKIASVTTYGSPVSASENTDVASYTRYAAEGDIVPYLEGRDAYTAMLLSPVIGPGAALSITMADRAAQTTIPGDPSGRMIGADGTYLPHDIYKKSPVLDNTPIPFTINKWDAIPTVCDPGQPNSSLAAVQKNLAPIGAAVTDGAQAVTNAVSQGAQSVVNVADSVARSTANSTGNFFSNLF